MPGFIREHLRPLAGAAGLHLLLFAIVIVAAWRWSSSQPPEPLAIEGVVVDSRMLPATPAASTPRPAVRQAPVPEPTPSMPAPARPEPAKPQDAERREAEAQARAERERVARDRAALERRQAQEADLARQKKAADEAARKEAEALAVRRKAADDEARRKAAEAQARKAAADQKAREAELQERLVAEEAEAASAARAGVVDQYRAELTQAIERSWIRPPSAQPGLECTLYVTQAPGGTVLDVRLGTCNGDAAVRESITNAVFRASPLPAPADPRAFERRLEIVFRPVE